MKIYIFNVLNVIAFGKFNASLLNNSIIKICPKKDFFFSTKDFLTDPKNFNSISLCCHLKNSSIFEEITLYKT